MKTRNKINLPINFCTTGNFLNPKKIKFNSNNNPPKIKNSKHQLINLHNKSSQSNLSEYHIKKEQIAQKDELIQKLQERIKFLENKIKILENNTSSKSKNRSRNTTLNNTLILKTEKSSNKHIYTRTNSRINKTIIPLDKQLLKAKLIKKKKNLFELIDLNKIKIIKKIKSRNDSLNNKNNNNNSLSNNTSNYIGKTFTRNNSCLGSASKSNKRTIKLKIHTGKINSFQNLLNYMNNNSNSKNNISKEKKYINKKINAINTIPKKGRLYQNTSTPKIMMSSTNYTNYSNNVSNSFKEENNNGNNNVIINTSFNEIQIKLENIKNRTKNLFEIYSKMNSLENNQNKNGDINRNKIKGINFPYNIKISKLEKIKK